MTVIPTIDWERAVNQNWASYFASTPFGFVSASITKDRSFCYVDCGMQFVTRVPTMREGRHLCEQWYRLQLLEYCCVKG